MRWSWAQFGHNFRRQHQRRRSPRLWIPSPDITSHSDTGRARSRYHRFAACPPNLEIRIPLNIYKYFAAYKLTLEQVELQQKLKEQMKKGR